jgi:hypothetical protein
MADHLSKKQRHCGNRNSSAIIVYPLGSRYFWPIGVRRTLQTYLSKNDYLYKHRCLVVFLCSSLDGKTEMIVTISVIGIGFFFAGVYPTTVANVGSILKGSRKAMAALLAISSLGGILTPALLGVVAEKISLEAGMGLIVATVILMLAAAAVLQFKKEGISS